MAEIDDDKTLSRLLGNNRAWADRISKEHPGFFEKLAKQQAPEVLWIGCSDSRVPANEIIGVMPGEVFVHRNVANQVMHVDFNCLAVVQYAVEALRVKHVIVCGHYGCGGVKAALRRHELGLLDNWLYSISNLREKYKAKIDAVGKEQSTDVLCELNVIEQVHNICNTSILQQAWRRGQDISVHGWIYGINDGHLHDLNVTVSSPDDVEPIFGAALAGPRLASRKK